MSDSYADDDGNPALKNVEALRIIDADTEAQLSYRSVAHHFRLANTKTLIADILATPALRDSELALMSPTETKLRDAFNVELRKLKKR